MSGSKVNLCLILNDMEVFGGKKPIVSDQFVLINTYFCTILALFGDCYCARSIYSDAWVILLRF